MNRQPYTLEPLPRKVENFIKRRDRATQERINSAFEHIIHSPFRHENPTTIKPLSGGDSGVAARLLWRVAGLGASQSEARYSAAVRGEGVGGFGGEGDYQGGVGALV